MVAPRNQIDQILENVPMNNTPDIKLPNLDLFFKYGEKYNSDIGICITGIAGPGGGTEKKPVGLVFVGIFYKNNLYIKRYNLTPDRITNRELTVTLCLNEIRKILRNS